MTSPHQERAAGSTASRKATTTPIPSPNPAAVGQAAAGTVTFPDGTTVLGTAALSAGGHTVAAVYGGDASDVTVGADLLRGHADLTVLGDKAYISAPLADEWRAECAVALLTVPRRNQRHQLPATAARRLNAARQIVETVNDQLTAQLGLAAHHAHPPGASAPGSRPSWPPTLSASISIGCWGKPTGSRSKPSPSPTSTRP